VSRRTKIPPFLFARPLPVRPKPRGEGGETPSGFFRRRRDYCYLQIYDILKT